jgi:hypothetical protein
VPPLELGKQAALHLRTVAMGVEDGDRTSGVTRCKSASGYRPKVGARMSLSTAVLAMILPALISCSHWPPARGQFIGFDLIGRHGAMKPAGRVRCNMRAK